MDRPKRAHRATGSKPPGGARPGAGRKPGSKGVLPYGHVQAVKALNWRVPESAPEPAKEVAQRSWDRIVDVLEERVGFQEAGHVLKAATIIREEICGPLKQRVEHSFSDMTDEQLEAKKAELLAKWAASGTPIPVSGE